MTFPTNTPLVGTTIAGKYRLIRRLGVGGMGDVYLARVEGLAGFEKHVAVKLLHEHLAGEELMMESFLAEARLAANLSHANIAQLYDLGQSDGLFYIAMEYVSGMDLRGLMAEAAKRDERLPIPLCCFVVARLCDGLDHAHRKRDGAGRPLRLVHRDVSPSNCLVSFSGEVKLIDFGIAKAAGEDSRTRTGMIKGKTAYLSPEQVQGWPLDRRSDIFSTGIVLYELLCGPRPFFGESDLSVMEAIRDVRYMQPIHLDPELPPALNAIVTRALARDQQARYQWASEMAADLETYLYSRGEPISARDVAEYIKLLVGGSRAVVAAEVLSPDPTPPTGSTRMLKSRARVRVPAVRPPQMAMPAGLAPTPLASPVVPPPPPPTAAQEPTQKTGTPERPAPSQGPTEIGPPPPPPEPPTDVGPARGVTTDVGPLPGAPQPPEPSIRTVSANLWSPLVPSRLPPPPEEVGIPTGIGSAPTLPAVPVRRPLRAAAVVAAFAIAGAAGFGWQRLKGAEAPAPPPRTASQTPPAPPAAAVAPPAPAPAAAPAGEPPAVAVLTDEVPRSAASEQTTVASVKPTPAPAPAPALRTPPRAPKGSAADRPARPAAAAPAIPAAAPVRTDLAYLNLRSNRPSEIVIDGKSIGRSPQMRFAVPPGRHEVRFDCLYDWGKATGEVQSLYLVPLAEGDVTHECVEIARP